MKPFLLALALAGPLAAQTVTVRIGAAPAKRICPPDTTTVNATLKLVCARTAPPPPVPVPVPLPVASITIFPPNAQLAVGDNFPRTAHLFAADGTELAPKAVVWASSDSTVVSVRADSTILGRASRDPRISRDRRDNTGLGTLHVPRL